MDQEQQNQQRARDGSAADNTLHDVQARALRHVQNQLALARQQLRHAQKLAAVGLLTAGVAHDINNPLGYLHSNFSTLQDYLDNIFSVLDAYQEAESSIADPAVLGHLRRLRAQSDLSFLRADITLLMDESKEGLGRVRGIAKDLQDFSRAESDQDWVWADVHRGMDATLNIVHHAIDGHAELIRQYGDLPEIECLPVQLNQVIMNLVVNAGQALGRQPGTIILRTGRGDAGDVWIDVEDSGLGISPEHLGRIFEPFFTTKPAGLGTGLGLSIARDIVLKHNGSISVSSVPGRGSTFRVRLPIRHAARA